MSDIDWNSGSWTNAPAHVEVGDDGMRVTAVEGSDAWRITSYGFVHDTEHALLVPFDQGAAMEVSFRLDLSAQFDQAGIFVRVDESTWIKAGVERSTAKTVSARSSPAACPTGRWRPSPTGAAGSSRSAPAVPATR